MQEDSAAGKKLASDNEVSLQGEHGYVEFLIEKTFFKKFRWYLRGLLTSIGIIFAVLAFYGYSKLSDFDTLLDSARTTRDQMHDVYSEYLRLDSLNSLRQVNARYYHTYLIGDRGSFSETAQERFNYNGFGFSDASVDSALHKYLYDDFKIRDNEAQKFVAEKLKTGSNRIVVGVIHNSLPDSILVRVKSIFREVYLDAYIEYFEDPELPPHGFVYQVGYPRAD